MRKFYLNGSLGLSYDGQEVDIKRCFPSLEVSKFFSVLNSDGEEVLFLENLSSLESEDQKVIKEYLSNMSFRLLIKEIISVDEEFGLRNWKIRTNAGERSFQTALDEWPEALNEKEVIIEDLNGDRYWISNIEELPEDSKRRLAVYLD